MTNLLPVAPNNPVRNWPAIHEHNMDFLDSLFGVTGLQTYTPLWTSLNGTDPTLGDSDIQGAWFRFLDTIYVWGRVTIGTTFAAGSGTYVFSLPVPIHTDFLFGGTTDAFPIGSAVARDITLGDTYTGVCFAEDANTFMVQDETGPGNSRWDLDDPFAWGANGDGLGFFAMYKAAS